MITPVPVPLLRNPGLPGLRIIVRPCASRTRPDLRLVTERLWAERRQATDGENSQARNAVSTSFTQYEVPIGITSSLKS